MGAAQNRGTSSRVSAESESLKLSFSYLVNSIDASSLLPDAFTDCVNEPNPYKKAEKFIGYLHREVNGDPNKFHMKLQFIPSPSILLLVIACIDLATLDSSSKSDHN